LTSLQVQFSLLAPEAAVPGGVGEVCRDLGIQWVAYSPLALGWLASGSDPKRPMPRGARGLLFQRFARGAEALRQGVSRVALGRQVPAAAVALNWCRAHGASPIPGVRSVRQVEEVAAARAWNLSPQERQELDNLAFANGVRMPANPFQSS
ncbi:MAG: aldo/keto reductase, partial [Cyanobacteriota bacterium]